LAGRAYLTTVETAWRRRAAYYATWHGRWDTELGGPLVTLAVHAHDVLTYVLGPVKSVMAHTKTLVNPIETEDTVSASLEMADGSLASLSVTTGSSVQITRHRFCFSNLTAESNLQPYRNTTDPWTFTGDSPEAEKQIEKTLSNFVPLPEDFAGQFYRASSYPGRRSRFAGVDHGHIPLRRNGASRRTSYKQRSSQVRQLSATMGL
jgi:predicted dehydrogenase